LKYSDEFRAHVHDTAQRGTSLLEVIGVPKNKESLLDVIQNIGSAARIEGADEIAHFSDVVQKLVNSIITGSIPLSINVKNILSEAFKELQNACQYETQINDKKVEDVKAVLNNIKKEEKDYMIFKKLKVLYIDEDTFSHLKVKRNSDKYIEIEPCLSAQEALSKLNSRKYDIILCNFKPADPITGDVFNFYSSRFPIVAISTSDNPRDAQTATRMGAMDYITKNDEGMKWISRSLHTVAFEWRKRSEQKTQKMIDPRAKKILKFLLNNTHDIRQVLDSHIKIVSHSGHTLRELEDTNLKDLDNLVALNYLSKDPAELTFSCPTCHSAKLRVHFICQNCRVSDFVKGKVIEHNKCGHSDLEENFVLQGKEDKMICPKCSKELRLIGVDYFRLESAFKCRHCSMVFSNPLQEYDCTECNLSGIKLQELGWTRIHNYSLIQSKIPEIKRNIITLDDIERFLENEGFKVNPDYKIQSKLETVGPFDIVAQKLDNIAVVVSLGADVEENFSKLVQMDTIDKAIVARRISKYAILFSNPQEIVLNLMNRFGIIPIVVDDTSKMLEKFKESFMMSFIAY
jgi:CheY-like chemotaxis protein/Zn finger protein HypA/HybF involved in hydrogenase expression